METIETLVYFFLNFVYARKRIQASKGYLSGVAAHNKAVSSTSSSCELINCWFAYGTLWCRFTFTITWCYISCAYNIKLRKKL